MDEALREERQPGVLLADFRSRERDRERAARWLGWALVVPDPEKLATEALLAQLKAEEQDHFATTLPSTSHESALDAAVDLANQARYLSEGGSGPCAGCARFEPHDEPFHEPVIEDHPIP